MKPILYSYDINHILHWENILKDTGYKSIDDLDAINDVKDELIIVAYEEKTFSTMHKLMENNKTLVLDTTPSLLKAKQVFANGARGYGNTLMSKVYMQSALESIQSENIWFIPTLTKELIQSLNTNESTTNTQKVLQNLTAKEKEIALLLQQGHYNQKIAAKLGVSINTVKSHIKNIYAKVGVKDKLSFIKIMG